MLTMTLFRTCLPLACRSLAKVQSRNIHLTNLPLRIDRTRNWLHLQPHLFTEKQFDCFLTKVSFHTNSPNAKHANDANDSPDDKKRLSSKRRRIISESSSSDGENGTQDVNRKSESVFSTRKIRQLLAWHMSITFDSFFDYRSPPGKKEKLEKTPMKAATETKKQEKTSIAKKTPKKTSSKEKSAKKNKSPAKIKSPEKSKSPAAKVKNENSPSTSTDQDKPSISDQSDDKIKTESSLSPAKKTPPPVNPFFLSSKQKKEQPADGAAPNGSEYSPAKANYHPIKDAFWKHGEK